MRLTPRRLKEPPQPVIQSVHLPAPVGGLNAIGAMGAMDPRDCVLLYNMIPSEYGLRARLGSRQWCTGLTGAGDNYVRSILPFTGSTDSGSQNRVFATTSSGIWDVTSSGAVIGGAYAASTAYAAGAAVSFSGGSYLCGTAGTSDAGGAPPAWQANHSYVMWDMVTSNGSVYVLQQLFATSGSIAQAPTGAADFLDAEQFFFWIYVGVAGACPNNKSLAPPRANLTAYKVGARAVFGGYVWHCSQPGTTGATEPDANLGGTLDGSLVWSAQMNVGGALSNAGVADSAIDDNTAVWKYLSSNTPPSLVYPFASTAGRAGHGTCHVQVTAGGHFLLYWDEENGLHVYTESLGTWAAPTQGVGAGQIDGVNPANLVSGTIWKGFVFHIERDTAKVWLTSAGAIYGTVTQLNTAFKLKAGGNLVCAATWTYDGGAGMDDALVLVSRGGDVLIWQGTDPTDASTFGLQGVWQVGALPAGRELMTDLGGELLIITRTGILPLSKLVLGKSIISEQYETSKISPIFNAAMLAKANTPGWSLRLHPEEGALIVSVPNGEGQATSQFAMSLNPKGWGIYRDLPAYCFGAFEGKMYFGTVDGAVCINDTYVDGQPLYNTSSYTPVQFSGITAANNLGNENQKQVQSIKPYFTGAAPPSYAVDARFDFNLLELADVAEATHTGDVWGSAIWGTAKWGGDYSPTYETRGASGIGVNAAIAWKGAATNRTILAGFGVTFIQGGPG